MKLVFENALNFNEPGSRIFRDAKLLMRLLHRLKERILARLGVPISQEDAVFRLSLSSRAFDVDALSEDKRKIKRFLTNNKSRTQSIEPENSQIPMINPYLLQQQQQQVQQAQQQMILQQQILLQQQQQQQQLQQMPPPAQQPMGMPQPQLMMQQPLYDINSFSSRPTPGATLSPLPETSVPSPKSPLGKASKEFYALFRNGGSFLNTMKLTALNNEQFTMSIDGEYLGHSIVVPSKVQTLVIQPEFPKELKEEEGRISITILQNNVRLNTAKDAWTTVPLTRGTNAFKINITANITQPDSNIPEYKSQIYHLFITQTW